MRELTVSFTGDGKAVLGDALSYQDEHCAVRLAVTLSEDLTSVEADEYYLSFVRDADADNPMTQKITVGPVQEIREGVLYYELPSFLTATTCLAAQLEAIKKDTAGAVTAAVKSPPFLISLQPSLQGEEALPVTYDANSLLERLLDAEAQTVRLNLTLATALDQGLFLAKINGRNAVTLQGGRNLILTDDSGVITIDCTALPIVTALPEAPQPGETVLLIPQNTVTLRESGRELTTSAELLRAAAVSEWQELLRQPASRYPFYINLRRAGELVGFLSASSDWEEGDAGQQNAVSIFSFVTGMRGNQAADGCEVTFVNGVFCPERSSQFRRGVVTELQTIPSSIRLPVFDAVEIAEQDMLSVPAFFGSVALMSYCGQWLEIASLSADRHHHDNAATLDGFYCDAVEAQAAAPAGQPGLSLDYTGWDRLRWGGAEVRMADDGGVIRRVETVTNGGKSYLRLWLYYGEVQTITSDAGSRPDYIDIPIDSAVDSTAQQNGLIVNGTELDLGVVPPVNPNWNENDPFGQSYIQNRTHWAETGTVFTDHTVEWLGTTPTYQAQPWAADDLGITLNEGETYTLQAAGATITCACQKMTMTDQGLTQDYYFIGNLHIYDPSAEDNGFPMLLAVDNMWRDDTIIKTWNIVLTSDTLFGSDLSFRLGKAATVYHPLPPDYLPESVRQAAEQKHTHDNAAVLDGLSTVTCGDFSWLANHGEAVCVPCLCCKPGTFSGTLAPNIYYTFGDAQSPALSVTVTSLCAEQAFAGLVPEYRLDFITGATAPTLTLPASVEWAEELILAPDKHYQIAICNNVARWCAADREPAANE